jgi:hypothetical protein
MLTNAIQELSADEYVWRVEISRDRDMAIARSRSSASTVQGCRSGCLDDGEASMSNTWLPPAFDEGVGVLVVIGDDQHGDMAQNSESKALD